MRLTIVCLTLLALTAAWVAHKPDPSVARTLAECSADYIEDEPGGRRLAAIGVLVREAGVHGAVVQVTISAHGPHVDPVPGFRGVYGANHITARELTALLEASQLRVLAMPRNGTEKRFGRVVPTEWGTVPERRLRSGGRLDLEAHSAATYVLQIQATSPTLSPGSHEIYLEAKGVPRLRVDVHIGAGKAEILGVHSLGGHDLLVFR